LLEPYPCRKALPIGLIRPELTRISKGEIDVSQSVDPDPSLPRARKVGGWFKTADRRRCQNRAAGQRVSLE
jgi:hypothetical protein